MKSADKIDRYVDATREVSAWERIIREEGPTAERAECLKSAKARRSEYERTLTGGDLGKARRMLATPPAEANATA